MYNVVHVLLQPNAKSYAIEKNKISELCANKSSEKQNTAEQQTRCKQFCFSKTLKANKKKTTPIFKQSNRTSTYRYGQQPEAQEFVMRYQQLNKQETQLSLRQPTILVFSDLQGHPRSMIFISSEMTYAIS